MPTISIFIRKDDLPKWKALDKKSEFISRALNPQESTIPRTGLAHVKESKELQTKLCKNGHPIPYPKDKCLGKGCKYS